MKVGEIRKLVVEYYDETAAISGIIFKVSNSEIGIYSTNGLQHLIRTNQICKDTSTRLPAETRSLLKKWYGLYKKLQKEKEKYEEVKRTLITEMEKINESKLAATLGTISREEFIHEFVECLSSDLRRDLEAFTISLYRGYIAIESKVDIEKYFRKGSFVFEEYDGTIQFADDYKNDPSYQAYINQYKKILPIKQKPEVWLSIGDHDWLSCITLYKVKVNKPFTKEYAKEIAAQFAD